MTIISILPGLFTGFLFIDAESLIRYGGLFLVCLIIYGSTGLFFCFFLPSGAILFSAGVFVATGKLYNDIFTVCSLLIAAAAAGSITGYVFGRKAGPVLYRKKDSKLFRRKHLIAAEVFYEQHGALALIIAYFMPIIRTFAPVVAGMIRVDLRRYLLLSLIGSFAWVISFVLAGYFIGSNPVLKPWLKYIVIGFLLLVTVPLLIRIIREMRKPRKEIEKDFRK